MTVLSDTADCHLERNALADVRQLASEVLSFYLESFPIAASLFSDPQLLARHREVVAELLVGACLHRAFLVCFSGEVAAPDHIAGFAADVVNALEPVLNAS